MLELFSKSKAEGGDEEGGRERARGRDEVIEKGMRRLREQQDDGGLSGGVCECDMQVSKA